MSKRIGCMLLIWCMMQVSCAESVQILQEKLISIHTMQAHFSQTVTSKNRVVSRSSGVMALSRPNQFRWHTLHPMPQIVVADGKKVWVYDVDLEQVTVAKQGRNLGAAGALFLSQSATAVQQDFNVQLRQQGVMSTFDLRAKSTKSQFEQVHLTFNQDQLVTIKLDDQLGQHTVIHLSQRIVNRPIPARIFEFRIPSGVDVVTQ